MASPMDTYPDPAEPLYIEFLDVEDERKYYRIKAKTRRKCFVPFCENRLFNKLGTKLIKIRDSLKQDWCDKVGVNKTIRNMYCCEKHLNLENDLENYDLWKNKGAHPKMKATACLRNYLSELPIEANLNYERPSTTGSGIPHKLDAATETHVLCANKGVTAKPLTKDAQSNYHTRTHQKLLTHCLKEEYSSEGNIEEQSASGSQQYSSTETSNEKVSNIYYGRNHLLNSIKNNPKANIGVPKGHYWILKDIADRYKTKELYVILTLFKLKNNDTFARLAEEFQLTYTTVQRQFQAQIQYLGSYFRNFIFLPPLLQIKSNLPLVFRMRFSKVQMIIDCLEVEIEKPSDPIRQSQTWSQYKSCNTLKYLVACTPSGFVCFISKGYGGRISDKNIIHMSGFIDFLPTGAVIMADRGFKDIAVDVAIKNVKIIRPPSVFSGQKLTKEEVIMAKVIASLRIHVERLIRRIREFKICKPHSTINHNIVKLMNEIMIIVCGLSNLQDPIIKEF